MAVSSPSPASPTPEAAKGQAFDQYVSRCLDRASSHVKWVDLITAILLIATVSLGVLLAVCLVDAWVLALGPWVRLTVLIGLVTFALLVLVRTITPLVLHRINPAYTARMIEQSEPKFKNSLINYVFLRSMPQAQGRKVYEAVQSKAAHDLSAISIESAVDRSPLIHVGFALLAVTLASGLYKLVSPKDPFVSVARVIAPLSDLPAPSRVRILDVDPGTVEILFGETVEVVAEVQGAGSGIPVTLMYSTDDGQQVAVPIPLVAGERSNKYSGTLTNSDSGIQQSLSYWVVAADGRSPTYRVNVRPSPTITVSKLTLTPPKYTELPTIQVLGQGDMSALEGTKVQIEAIANEDVGSATLELLDRSNAKSTTPEQATRDTTAPAGEKLVDRLPMQVVERTASNEFRLAFKGDQPRFTHYRLTFVTKNGQRSRGEPVYSVLIKPDMAPELEVLEPKQNQLQIPLNGSLPIHARAMDPDFRLTAIRMTGLRQGKLVVQQNLTLDQKSGLGQVMGRYTFRPEAAGLQVGDELVFHLAAIDNRVSSLNDQPDPNITRSANYQLKILAPLKENQGASGDRDRTQPADSSDDPSQADDASSENAGGNHSDDASQSGGEQNSEGEGESGGQGNQSDNASQSDPSQGQSGGEGNPKDAQANNQNASPDNQNSSASSGQPGERQPDRNPQGENSGDAAQSNNASSGQAGENSGGNPADAAMNPQAGGENAGENQGSNPGQPADGETAQHNAGQQNSAGERSNNSSDAQPNDAADHSQTAQPGDASAGEDAASNSERADAERPMDQASHDGERFEKLLERMEQERNASGNRGGNAESLEDASQSESSNSNSGNRQPSNSGETTANNPNSQAGQRGGDNQAQSNAAADDQGSPERAPDSQGERGAADQAQGADGTAAQNDNGKTPGENAADPSPKAGGAEGEDGAKEGPDGEMNPSEAGEESGGNPQGQSGRDAQSETGEPSPAPGEQAAADSASSESNDGETPSQPSTPGQAGENSQRGADQPMGDQTQFPEGLTDADRSLETNIDTAEEREELARTKKVTDLVVDYLRDHQHNPDPDLLNEMNWTEQELRDFVKRWEHLKTAASSEDKQAGQRYADALRGLGLRHRGETTVRPQVAQDAIRDLNEDGSISRLPEKYAEAFRDFSKGRAKREAQK